MGEEAVEENVLKDNALRPASHVMNSFPRTHIPRLLNPCPACLARIKEPPADFLLLLSSPYLQSYPLSINMLVTKELVTVPSSFGDSKSMGIYVISPVIPGYPQAKFPGVVVFRFAYRVR